MRDTLLHRFESKLNRTESGCWLWTGSTHKRTGYGQVIIEKGRPNYTHRVAYELYKGHIPRGMCVLHRCDVRHCCNPDHLFLGTDADNIADMMAKKRHLFGAKVATAKLTEAEALEVKFSVESSEITAQKYGISPRLVRAIRSGEKWSHLPMKPK